MIPKVKYYGPRIPSTYAINLTAAASGSNGITVADDNDINSGTASFGAHWEGSRDSWRPASAEEIYTKYQDASNYVSLICNTDGTVRLLAVVAGVTILDETSSAAVATTYNGKNLKLTFSCSRETASAAGSFQPYIDAAVLGAAQSITAASPTSISNSGALYIAGTDSKRFASNTISFVMLNFAPTASEVLDLCTNGIPASWKWGRQTAIGATNGDFETWSSATNPATWAEGANVSSSVSQVTGGGQYAGTYSLQFTGAGLPSTTFNNTIYQSGFWSNGTVGKKYRIQIAAKRTSGTGNLYVGQGATAYSAITSAMGLSSSWNLFTIEKTITANDSNASLLIIAGDSGSTFQVDAYTITPLGATMALLPDTIPTSSATTWSDTSGNTGGGTLPAAGATKVTIRR